MYPAGLVRVLTAACPELAAAIEQQQQQQQQSPAEAESLLCTRLLAAAVLHVLRRCILADRPAQVREGVVGAVFKRWYVPLCVFSRAYNVAGTSAVNKVVHHVGELCVMVTCLCKQQ
jgi:hypothetical protein